MLTRSRAATTRPVLLRRALNPDATATTTTKKGTRKRPLIKRNSSVIRDFVEPDISNNNNNNNNNENYNSEDEKNKEGENNNNIYITPISKKSKSCLPNEPPGAPRKRLEDPVHCDSCLGGFTESEFKDHLCLRISSDDSVSSYSSPSLSSSSSISSSSSPSSSSSSSSSLSITYDYPPVVTYTTTDDKDDDDKENKYNSNNDDDDDKDENKTIPMEDNNDDIEQFTPPDPNDFTTTILSTSRQHPNKMDYSDPISAVVITQRDEDKNYCTPTKDLQTNDFIECAFPSHGRQFTYGYFRHGRFGDYIDWLPPHDPQSTSISGKNDICVSANHYDIEMSCISGQMGYILNQCRSSVLTVCFNKVITQDDISFIFWSQNSFNTHSTPGSITRFLKETLFSKSRIERTIRGRVVGSNPRIQYDGYTLVEDLECQTNNRYKKVNNRSIVYIIYRGIKYVNRTLHHTV